MAAESERLRLRAIGCYPLFINLAEQGRLGLEIHQTSSDSDWLASRDRQLCRHSSFLLDDCGKTIKVGPSGCAQAKIRANTSR
jgi:hypothetical protein